MVTRKIFRTNSFFAGEKAKRTKGRIRKNSRRIRGVIIMKKHEFYVGVCFAAGVSIKEIVELPENLTDEEVEEQFKEWVWDQLDAHREEIE